MPPGAGDHDANLGILPIFLKQAELMIARQATASISTLCFLALFILSPDPCCRAASETALYSYDNAGRLVRESFADGTEVSYTYDLLGNRLSQTTTSPAASENTPPHIPNTPSPGNGASDISASSSTLSWAGGDADSADLVYYDIRFGTTPDPEFYFRTTDTALALPQLNALQTYYWQIVAVDSRRATTAGPVWSFTTANLPPLSPSSPVPADGATIVKDNVSLNWAVATDPDEEDIVSYNVYFGSSPTLSLAADNITETAYTPGDLIVGNTYFWQIVAIDSHGGTTPGPVWSFTTIGSATVLNNVVHAADTTLTKAGGPYIVRGGMTVNAGITLTIEAGTVLKFEDSASLTVNGTLLAQGSPAGIPEFRGQYIKLIYRRTAAMFRYG